MLAVSLMVLVEIVLEERSFNSRATIQQVLLGGLLSIDVRVYAVLFTNS